MYYHIHYLKIIIITCLVCFPSAFVFFGSAVQLPKCSIARKNAIMICAVYGILISIVSGMGCLKNIRYDLSKWIFVGAGFGIIVIFIEFMMAQLKAKMEFGNFAKKVSPPKSYLESFSIINVFLIILAASFEEILFRQIIIVELYSTIAGWGMIIGIVLSCILYAINHVYFGVFAVIQKIASGLIFSSLFIVSEYNVLVPIMAHCVQNLVLYIYGVYTHGKEPEK